MSNTPNPNEIDEVMSSVRKLVSRGERSPDVTTEGDALSEAATASEKLILTPALRVDEPDAQDAEPPAPSDENRANVLVLDPEKHAEAGPNDATIAQLAAAVAEPVEDWQPEETEAFDEADWAVSAMGASDEPEFFDVTEEPGRQEEHADVSSDPDDELAAFLPQEPAIDPAMLREMIAQIVREELAGDTGERITRNVRKLVRREINLILASRDLR